jgi:hypothetical protein
MAKVRKRLAVNKDHRDFIGEVDINRAWKTIRQNIKMSSKESRLL